MLEESVLTVLCLHCVCCTSLSEISAHLPAFKEEFKAEHRQLAAAVDQLPDAIFGDRAPATVQKYTGAFDRWSAWAKKTWAGIFACQSSWSRCLPAMSYRSSRWWR